MYYCFSELTDPSEHGIALERVRISRQRFKHDGRLLRKNRKSPRAWTWTHFYDGLKRCTYGRKLWTATAFEAFVERFDTAKRRAQVRQMYDVFVMYTEERLLVAPDTLPSGRQLG
jgi:hypothetical protein